MLFGFEDFPFMRLGDACTPVDTFARSFLARNPGGLVVDIGCGLDTRFNRLDDGQLIWLGVDLPEVIQLRRQWLPEDERCRTIAQSMFDLTWLDEVARINQPVIFLAEGLFPYFSTGDVRPMITAMAERFPKGELVFDAMAPYMGWYHKLESSELKRSGTQLNWDAKNLAELEAWGLCLLERWGYFDKPEPRMGERQRDALHPADCECYLYPSLPAGEIRNLHLSHLPKTGL